MERSGSPEASWEWKGPGAQRWTRSFYFQVAAIQKELHREYPQVKIVTKGNTITWEDVQENLQQTHADGLMSAEGIFDHPALFLQRYGTDPERPVTGLRLSDKMRQLTAKLWTLALKEVITSKVDTYNAKLQKSSSIVVDQVTVTLTACCKPTNSNSLWNISISPPCFQFPNGRPFSYPPQNSCRSINYSPSVYRVRHWTLSVDYWTLYQENPAAFQYNTAKAATEQQALERKRCEEGKQKHYEARMARKAKREQLPLDSYFERGNGNANGGPRATTIASHATARSAGNLEAESQTTLFDLAFGRRVSSGEDMGLSTRRVSNGQCVCRNGCGGWLGGCCYDMDTTCVLFLLVT